MDANRPSGTIFLIFSGEIANWAEHAVSPLPSLGKSLTTLVRGGSSARKLRGFDIPWKNYPRRPNCRHLCHVVQQVTRGVGHAPSTPPSCLHAPKRIANEGPSCDPLPPVLWKPRWQLACVACIPAATDGGSFGAALKSLNESDWDAGNLCPAETMNRRTRPYYYLARK
jgi:hypothetical protein